MQYRKLRGEEILVLEQHECSADSWDNIEVNESFSPNYICRVQFSGKMRIGKLDEVFDLPGGIKKHSQIKNACFHNCEIGDNVIISDVHNYIANYKIGNNVIIHNLEQMYVEGVSTFGNGIQISVLNETGGREVIMHDKLSSHFAYIQSFYRHRPQLIQKMNEMVLLYTNSIKSTIGVVGDNSKIINSGTIRNVKFGNCSVVEGTRLLENGSINSNNYDPIHIGYNVMLTDFIVSSGSKIEDGSMLTRCFIGQACHIGHTYSASDSLFFSNCQGENGEACSIFAGPYTVTHHKSTLLIAGLFSFMNAGSGSNQSNHMYKLGPIHQGVMERGSKTTSNSYILWPAKIGAFSLVMGRHSQNPDTSKMPFSYLIENDDQTTLIPGVNLRSVGTIRDAQKFPQRDKRKDPKHLDHLNFNLLSPYTVQKMFEAIDVLTNLQQTCGETSETYTYKSCKIKASSLKNGLKYYDMAINKFLGNSILSRLENCSCESDDQIREYLLPKTSIGLGKWRDLSGLFTPSSEIDRLIVEIENGNIDSIEAVGNIFELLHSDYYEMEWTWAWDKIEKFYHLDIRTITRKDVIYIINKWRKAVIDLDYLIYEDAKKEFSLSSHISFGIDGDSIDRKLDFEQVRGVFEQNTFVKTVLDHIESKTRLGNNVINKLRAYL